MILEGNKKICYGKEERDYFNKFITKSWETLSIINQVWVRMDLAKVDKINKYN